MLRLAVDTEVCSFDAPGFLGLHTLTDQETRVEEPSTGILSWCVTRNMWNREGEGWAGRLFKRS